MRSETSGDQGLMIQQKKKRHQKILPLAIKDFVPLLFLFRSLKLCVLMADFRVRIHMNLSETRACEIAFQHVYRYPKDVEAERKILANFIALDSSTYLISGMRQYIHWNKNKMFYVTITFPPSENQKMYNAEYINGKFIGHKADIRSNIPRASLSLHASNIYRI